MSAVKVDLIVKLYMAKRHQKELLEAAHKDAVKALNDEMLKIEGFLMQQMDAEGVSSYKTEYGTAFKSTTDFANVADWSMTLDFIIENKKLEMLERRVNKTAVRAYMEETGGIVPGVNYGQKVSINIRKPTATA